LRSDLASTIVRVVKIVNNHYSLIEEPLKDSQKMSESKKSDFTFQNILKRGWV